MVKFVVILMSYTILWFSLDILYYNFKISFMYCCLITFLMYLSSLILLFGVSL